MGPRLKQAERLHRTQEVVGSTPIGSTTHACSPGRPDVHYSPAVAQAGRHTDGQSRKAQVDERIVSTMRSRVRHPARALRRRLMAGPRSLEPLMGVRTLPPEQGLGTGRQPARRRACQNEVTGTDGDRFGDNTRCYAKCRTAGSPGPLAEWFRRWSAKPFTAVQFRHGPPSVPARRNLAQAGDHAAVVQTGRTPPCQGGGREFKSRPLLARQPW